jgi:hypothetical protein
MNPVKPDIGDVALPLSCFEGQPDDHRSVLVIAGAWLALYVVMLGDFAFTRAAEAFAALH